MAMRAGTRSGKGQDEKQINWILKITKGWRYDKGRIKAGSVVEHGLQYRIVWVFVVWLLWVLCSPHG